MLQKFSLMLGILMVLGISACSKPINDSQARNRILGVWKETHYKYIETGVEFDIKDGQSEREKESILFDLFLKFGKDGTLCMGEMKNAFNNCSGRYRINKNELTFIDKDKSEFILSIVKLTNKELVLRFDKNGSEQPTLNNNAFIF